jgi:hypothetical protein
MHNTHVRQISVPQVGFQPIIPASERPQTDALDRAASGNVFFMRLAQIFLSLDLILIECSCFLLQLAQLLPMEENFLLLFRFDNPLESSVEFMKVSLCKWSHILATVGIFNGISNCSGSLTIWPFTA